MPAYVIADVEIHDPAIYDEYRKLVPATLAKYGGKFLVRGGAFTKPEASDWQPGRLVILEFADRAAAEAWHGSPEYAPALALRQKAAKTRMVIVDGAAG